MTSSAVALHRLVRSECMNLTCIGQTAATGQIALLLVEDDSGANATQVPPHDMGKRMQLCLIAEVSYTLGCKLSFQDSIEKLFDVARR